MALLSYQQELFYLEFTGGSGGTAFYYIVYDQNHHTIYVTDSNGIYQSVGIVGDPPISHDADVSTYFQCQGTTALKFVGNLYPYPYCTSYYEENSASCPFYYRKLRIKIPVTITPDDGTNSGEITVAVQSAQGTLQYKLNSGAYQSSPTFSGLAEGLYTITAYDQHYTDSVDVYVPYSYEYATKYQLKYYDIDGILTTVNIKKKGYSGAVTDLTGTGNPVVLNYPGDENKLNAVFGSELKLAIMSFTNYQFLEFYSSDNREFILEYKKGSTTIWTGYLLTDTYSEAYTVPPYPIEVTATDGIGILKNELLLDDYGNRLFGRFTYIEIIQFILSKLDLSLPLYAASNIYENSMSTGSSAFAQMYINSENLYDDEENTPNCFDILEKLLTTFTARIYQNNGRFELININLMYQSFIWYIFNPTYSSSQAANLKIYNVGAKLFIPGNHIFVNNSALLEIIPAWKRLTSKFNPGYKELIGSDFSLNSWWVDSSTLREWSGNATVSKVVSDANQGNEYALNIDGYAFAYNSCEYIEMKVESVEATTDLLLLELNTRLNRGNSTQDLTGFIYISVMLISAIDDVNYVYDLVDNDGWVELQTTDTPYIQLRPDQANQWQKLEASLDGIPYDGDLILRICQYKRNSGTSDYITSIDIKDCKISQIGGIAAITKEVEETTNIGNFNEVPDDFILPFADAPDVDNKLHIYKNILLLDSQTPTSTWSGYTLNERFNIEAKVNYTLPTHKISGTMRGPMRFSNVLYDEQDPSKNFILGKLTINDKKQTNDVEWLQIFNGDIPAIVALTVDSTDYTADDDTITTDQTIE